MFVDLRGTLVMYSVYVWKGPHYLSFMMIMMRMFEMT